MGPFLRTRMALGFRSYWIATAFRPAVGLLTLNSTIVARSAEAQS